MQVHGEVGGRVGTDRHEGGMANRDLAGVADQNIEAQRADDGDEGEVDDGKIVLVQGQRQNNGEEKDDGRHRPARDRQRV
jgi:hypothetical protein